MPNDCPDGIPGPQSDYSSNIPPDSQRLSNNPYPLLYPPKTPYPLFPYPPAASYIKSYSGYRQESGNPGTRIYISSVFHRLMDLMPANHIIDNSVQMILSQDFVQNCLRNIMDVCLNHLNPMIGISMVLHGTRMPDMCKKRFCRPVHGKPG